MANYILIFKDFLNPENDIRVNSATDPDGKGCIQITGQNEINYFCINLDISTAIKFAKTLRTEINKAKEVDNG